MKTNKIFNLLFLFLIVGLCLFSARECVALDNRYQQDREDIIVRTMADLQMEENGGESQDKQSVLVLEKNIEEIPLQSVSVEIDHSRNDDVYVSQKIQKDVTSHTLKPRFEANWRYSNDRSILMGEFWLPLMQCEDESVLFCDIRLMGDDSENKEFNVGVGYREVLEDTILGDGVAGAMLWFDRRFTDRDFQFNQVTVGGEWLGEQYDLRMNGYFPIDKKKSYLLANPNGTGQGFVGNQILVNTDQVVVEEVLPGIDFELGSQLNFMNGVTDSTRFFVGGYHFEADLAEDITGVRTRIVSDITSDVQIGARFQHDDVRGSQTYVESTIRFPFGHKKKYKHEGLWSRLDETPERDIDVVSNEVITVQGRNEALLNATTGLKQNVIHVDNTAPGGGNGTIEKPYSTLAAAEGAATTNDMIYVHKGDGTTTNQNIGIALDDAGQMLAGSGTDLLYNTDRFKTSNGNNVTGALIEATTAPMITNGAGNGVDITADNVFVSGITVDGATTHGIYALNADNVVIDNVTSDNNASMGIRVDANAATLTQVTFNKNIVDTNGVYGLFAYAISGGDIGTVNFTGNTITNTTASTGIRSEANGVGSSITTTNFINNRSDNNLEGFRTYAVSSGDIGTANFINNSADSNTDYGFIASSVANGAIGAINLTGNTATNNTSHGLYAFTSGAGSTITTANFTSNSADTNGGNGLFAYSVSAGDIGTAHFTSNTSNTNGIHGIRAEVNGVGSSITTANFVSNIANNNSVAGYLASALNSGSVTTANFTSNTADSNTSYGFYVYAVANGDIGTANFTSNTATNNISTGIRTEASGAGSTLTTTNLTNNISNNNGFGYLVYAQLDGDIGQATLTNNTAINNTSYGFYTLAANAGSNLSVIDLNNNVASSNLNIGFYVHVVTDGDIAQASLEDNTSTNNTSYGITINDDSAAGGIVADLGGGAFGSTGGNSVSGNTNEELLVDLDGGALKAENNWWGSASGLTGAETLLQDASTVDAAPFLTSDPK